MSTVVNIIGYHYYETHETHETTMKRLQRLKRLCDIIICVPLVLAVSPLLLLIALAIKCAGDGPVLFRQQRIGLHRVPFIIYKFRSMVADAATGHYLTHPDDPRITTLGKWLRKTSLDELPQLFNVLKGDMSLVGPRPYVPAYEHYYSPDEWVQRHLIKPGITGMVQATLRSVASMEQRKQLELQYHQQRNLLLDFKIMMCTVRQVLCRGGF